MRFSVAALITLAIGAMAAPQQGASPYPMPGNDVTVGVAGDTCGKDMELSCCNHVDQSGDSSMEADGILAGALQGVLADGEVGLFSGCSKLSVTACECFPSAIPTLKNIKSPSIDMYLQ